MVAPAALPHMAYFHGLPGGPGEWSACAPAGLAAYAPDRNAPVDPASLARQVAARCGTGPITLIGFSLGVPVALAVARALGPRVAHVHLVSPAAPLQLGHFLDDMAGGTLFRLAATHPRLFRAVAQLESLIARIAPAFLLSALFASAAGADRILVRDPAFRHAMTNVLREGLGRDPRGFLAEVSHYVADWRAELALAHAPITIWPPITIWQGDADNWTPPAMAQALAAALPGPVTMHSVPGCSHYSTLRAALARLNQHQPT